MSRTAFADTIVVTSMVTAVVVGSASAAAASTTVPANRGWVTGSGHGDLDGNPANRD
jgi:hypothetical protein